MFVLCLQRVEGVEEFFLRALFAGNELHVVHQQHVDVAIGLAELFLAGRTYRVDEVVGELLRRDIHHEQPTLLLHVTDGVQQVCLAQTNAAVDDQWVVGVCGIVRDRLRGRMGQAVAVADDEGAKRIFGI